MELMKKRKYCKRKRKKTKSSDFCVVAKEGEGNTARGEKKKMYVNSKYYRESRKRGKGRGNGREPKE